MEGGREGVREREAGKVDKTREEVEEARERGYMEERNWRAER